MITKVPGCSGGSRGNPSVLHKLHGGERSVGPLDEVPLS